ncbi:unnamed protein product [Owenia fusiformis]|uniref:Uncharacterized protein n=1 Tax=Owenia fusiformis TaxID=6347 RepID=A0A8J1U761_OWEFU|nr:unnamed protein product [Owenia fusiformis]
MMKQLVVLLGMACAVHSQMSSMQKLGSSNNEFALNLYNKLNEETDGNLFFGPLSISTAMAMLYMGADGDTKTQIEQVMRYENIGENFRETFQDLNKRLYNRNNNYTLKSANRLFGDQQFTIKESFLTDTNTFFDAELEEVDFRADAEAARQKINGWVKERTEGKIEDLMPEDSITSMTVLVLVNAMYFKGKWKSPFVDGATKKGSFYTSDNDVDGIQMDFMNQQKKFQIHENAELKVKVLELPYEGDDLSMYVVLPDMKMGLGDIEKILNIETLETLVDTANFEEKLVQVSLPKFEIAQKFDLRSNMAALGMADLFSNTKANLNGISEGANLFVSALAHKAYVIVNEEGTEAAASTGAEVSLTSVQFPVAFKADHPFMFFVREKSSGSIVFVGRILGQPDTDAVFGGGFEGGEETKDNMATATVASMTCVIAGVFAAMLR